MVVIPGTAVASTAADRASIWEDSSCLQHHPAVNLLCLTPGAQRIFTAKQHIEPAGGKGLLQAAA